MKTGAPGHPKMIALSITLKIPIYAAVGIMEMLWHFADKHAIQGDIGKYPDQVISQSVGWDRTPEELISALVTCRWLDRSDRYRLLIHDWEEHCQNYCKKRLKSSKLSIHRSESTTSGDLDFSGKFQNFLPDSEKSENPSVNLPLDRQPKEPSKTDLSPSVSGGYKIPENSGKFQKKGVGGAYSVSREVLVVNGRNTPPTPSNGKTQISDSELQEVSDGFDRHLKHANREPRDLVIQQVLSMNGKFDWPKFRERHGPYCAYYAEKGWRFCTVTFLGWINAGMPPAPPNEGQKETAAQRYARKKAEEME